MMWCDKKMRSSICRANIQNLNVVFAVVHTPGVALISSDAGGDDQRSSDGMWQKMRSSICRADIQNLNVVFSPVCARIFKSQSRLFSLPQESTRGPRFRWHRQRWLTVTCCDIKIWSSICRANIQNLNVVFSPVCRNPRAARVSADAGGSDQQSRDVT